MKLLHVSDLHFRPHWFEWVAKEACHYDAVCIAGDLLDMFGTHETGMRDQAAWVRTWIRGFSGRLFVCSGNHDWWDSKGVVDNDAHGGWLDKMGSNQVTVDGQGAVIGGYHIFCHPFRFPACWPQAPSGKWILLHHAPPAYAGTGVTGSTGKDQGCRELAAAIIGSPRPPWLILSGHIHKPKSWRGRHGASWSFNPTFDAEAPWPNHITIDTESGVVTWITSREGTWPVRVL
ncbi:MAG: metallophosphoesterase [Opitutaceae bacterium]|nr:metallophosphoesterase [Opitutaceae bacterium]